MPVTCLVLNCNLVNKSIISELVEITTFMFQNCKATDLDGWVHKIRQLIS